jgi:hypothetical protein
MAFEVGQSYERLRDGKRAIVAYARPAAALLRLDAGKQEWITSADLPRKWRRYEGCPSCRGSIAAAEKALGTASPLLIDAIRRGMALARAKQTGPVI